MKKIKKESSTSLTYTPFENIDKLVRESKVTKKGAKESKDK